MRIIVHGVGAIGGTVAAALAEAGRDVLGIARGAQLDAIRANGLRLRAPGHDFVARFPCVASPAEVDWRPDDVILLCMKTQHCAAALDDLHAAGVQDQAIFCAQNGVENERMALRRFANVHGVTVMMPATYLTPGEVTVWVEPRFGIFELGRYPGGTDAADDGLAKALEAANIAAFVKPDVMAGKYGKLLKNLGNALRAAAGETANKGALARRVEAEGADVLAAAGIPWRSVGDDDPRRAELMRMAPVAGARRAGGSTVQSLMRGTGNVETDYLNGEIALLARQHGVPAPLNAALTALAADYARTGQQPGAMTLEDLTARIGAN